MALGTRIFLLVTTIAVLFSQKYDWGKSPFNFSKVFAPEPPTVEVQLWFSDRGFRFPDLAEATQIQVDHEVSRLGHAQHVKIKVVDKMHDPPVEDRGWEAFTADMPKDKYTVALQLSGERGLFIETEAKTAWVRYAMKDIHSNDLPFFTTQAIVSHLLVPLFKDIKEGKVPPDGNVATQRQTA